MIYALMVDVILRTDLDALELLFDELSGFEKSGDMHRYRMTVQDKWCGVHNFTYAKEGQIIRGNFNVTSRDTYGGKLELNVEADISKVILPKISAVAPSLREGLAKVLTEQSNYQSK